MSNDNNVFGTSEPQGTNSAEQGLGDDSIWGDDSSGDQLTNDEEPEGGNFDEVNHVGGEDSETTPIDSEGEKRGSAKILVVIAAIALSVLGGAGYIVYSFIQKLNPKPVSAEVSGPAVLQDVPDAAPASLVSQGSLDLPNTAVAAPVDPQGSLPVTSSAPVETVVEASAPTTPIDAVAPGAAVHAAAPPTPPACVPAPQVCSPVDKPSPSKPKSAPKSAAAPGETSLKRSTKATQTPRPERSSKTRDSEAQKPSADRQPRVETRDDLGRLTGYKVVAIEPRSGEHQQAWIRNAEGRLFIVRAGDRLEGARVNSVSFDLGAVTTDRGVIRK